MSIDASQVRQQGPQGPVPTLADRVRARVAEAQRVFDNRPREANGKRRRHRPMRLTKTAAPLTNGSEAQREIQSLRRVYCEMRTIYRGYRHETGKPPVPELRTAVRAFRRGESLTSLIDIATFLDDRKLLVW